MTRDQVAHLQTLATEVQRALEANRVVPVHAIRALARLARLAANELEALMNRR